MGRILERPNRASAEEAASFVDKFEDYEAQIASEKSKFMLACKAIRKEQKELLDDAKSQGVEKQVVKGIVKQRSLEAKARAVFDDIEEDETRDFFVDIRRSMPGEAFSTLPLFAAAAEREAREEQEAGPDTAGIVEAAEKAWTEADQAAASVN